MESPKKTTRFSPAAGGLQRRVGVAIARQLSEIVGEDRDSRGPVLVKTGEASGRNAGLRLRRGWAGCWARAAIARTTTDTNLRLIVASSCLPYLDRASELHMPS